MITGVAFGVPPPTVMTRMESGATVQVFTLQKQCKIPTVTIETSDK